MTMIYLDSNATTRPAEEVVAAMTEALHEGWANPSSLHRPGQMVRQRMELARESVSNLIGCKSRDLVFTCGGTEAANLAISGSLGQQPTRNVIATVRTEHSAVREMAQAMSMRGVEVCWLPIDLDGVVDCDALRELLRSRAGEIAIVSVMRANNETGVVQPIEEIGTLCREHEVRFHSDAVQWVGKMPIDVRELPVDLLSFSAHKFHGPKGVGGLYIRRGVRVTAQIIGGPHEQQRRGGTENVPGIVGMGVAAERAAQWLATNQRATLEQWRDEFEQAVVNATEDASVNSSGAARVWNTSNIGFSRLEAEAILLMLSERGVCASAGAACSSGSLDPSPVLMAMGIPAARAHGSVRFSLCRETTKAELETATAIVTDVVARLRSTMTAV
jgi:cysteine desulfurase